VTVSTSTGSLAILTTILAVLFDSRSKLTHTPQGRPRDRVTGKKSARNVIIVRQIPNERPKEAYPEDWMSRHRNLRATPPTGQDQLYVKFVSSLWDWRTKSIPEKPSR